MPLILRPLQQAHAQMRLVISEEMTETLLRRLHNHEIDAALIATTEDDKDLDSMPLFDEPFWLAYPRGHALYTKDKITRRDLETIDLLLLSDGHCLAQQAMDVCHLQTRSAQGDMADLRAASLETLLQLVSAGFGSETNLLELRSTGPLAFGPFLFPFVVRFGVVHDPADRRAGIRGDLN